MAKPNSDSRQFDIFFFMVFILVIIGMFVMFRDFINVLFLSIIYSILVGAIYKFLTRKSAKMPTWLATLITMLVSLLIIAIPFFLIIGIIIDQATQLVNELKIEDLNSITEDIKTLVSGIQSDEFPLSSSEISESLHETITKYSSRMINVVVDLTSIGLRFILNFAIFIIVSFTLIPNLDKVSKYVLEISPLGKDITKLYLTKSKDITVTMLKGTLLVAIVQTLIAGFLLWIVGIPYVSLWMFIMFIFAIIPFFSTGFVTVPIGIYLIVTGDVTSGLVLILGQLLVVGTSDNVLKSRMATKNTNIAGALLILSLIGGIRVWGFFGIFYGPLLLVLFYTSLEVYRERYRYEK